MRTSLLTYDLRDLPKALFLFILLVYPFFAYIMETLSANGGFGEFRAFSVICLAYLAYRLLEINRTGSNLKIPLYLVLFGLFMFYTLFCSMFITDHFQNRGIKYFYTDPTWVAFIALLVAENISISNKVLNIVKKALWSLLIVATVVSIIQVYEPLFFRDDSLFVQGLSYDRLEDFYTNSKDPSISKGERGHVSRFFKGYRLSIFSYINGLSVGIDTLAIFSILLAWKPIGKLHRTALNVLALTVSFLSSSRWILLGFTIVASQFFLIGKNRLIKLFYFVLLGVLLLAGLGITAYYSGFDIEQYITERLLSDSASSRILAFEVFFQVFPDNPIFGTGGVDTEEMTRLLGGQSSQIHVGFLKIFYYYGLIGGLLYLAFMVAFLSRLRNMAIASNYWGTFFAILAFFIANLTLFEPNPLYFALLLAIIISNHFYRTRGQNDHTGLLRKQPDLH